MLLSDNKEQPADCVCPNLRDCRLPEHMMFREFPERLDRYRVMFCYTADKYGGCKRYIVNRELGFCPGFVLPDTGDNTESILNMYDELEND